jgi:hypothetical protein
VHTGILSIFEEIRTGIESITVGHAECRRIGLVINTLTQGSLGYYQQFDEIAGDIVGMIISTHNRMGRSGKPKTNVIFGTET